VASSITAVNTGVKWGHWYHHRILVHCTKTRLRTDTIQYITVYTAVLRPYVNFAVATSLSLPRCRYLAVATSLSLPRCRYLAVATSLSLPHYPSCHCSVLKLFSLRHDFIHSIASTVSILIRFRRSDIVIFDEEKSLSGAADIAGIESTSKAILERFGKSLCCVDSSHHLRTSSKSLWGGIRIYRKYSSPWGVWDLILLLSAWSSS
jgi:hypothetical protein